MSTEAQLADVAAACQPLRHAYLVGKWAGDGRTTTAEGWPLPGDLPELAAALDVATPETTLDPHAPALARAWVTAHEVGFVEIDPDGAQAGPALEHWSDDAEEKLDDWAASLVSAIHALLDTIDSAEAAQLAHTALEVLDGLETPTADTVTDELEQRMQDEYAALGDYLGADFNLVSVVATYCAALPGELRAFGAIDEHYAVTPLGQWALRELTSRGEEDSQALGELSEVLSAAGVDADDPDAIRQFLEQDPGNLLSLLGDTDEDTDDDDFRVLDLKAAFELPDELPPLSLPPRHELAATARTASAELDDVDDETAVATWQNQFYELLSNGNYLRTQSDDAGAQDVDEFDLDFTAVGAIIVMRLFLDGPAEDEEIREIVTESATLHLDPTAAAEEWANWVNEYGDPAEQLAESLLTAGAATRQDEEIELTDLGRDAVRDRLQACDVSVPPMAPAGDMSAVELISAIETVAEPEAQRLSSVWLASRDSSVAAAELLTLAKDGNPTQRMVAMTMTQQLDPAPVAQWEAALDVPALRPHAKMALADAQSESSDEEGEVELDSEELAWLLADSLAATVNRVGETELAEHLGESILPVEDEPELFDTVRHSGHPEAHAVLRTIGEHHPDEQTAEAARKAAQ